MATMTGSSPTPSPDWSALAKVSLGLDVGAAGPPHTKLMKQIEQCIVARTPLRATIAWSFSPTLHDAFRAFPDSRPSNRSPDDVGKALRSQHVTGQQTLCCPKGDVGIVLFQTDHISGRQVFEPGLRMQGTVGRRISPSFGRGLQHISEPFQRQLADNGPPAPRAGPAMLGIVSCNGPWPERHGKVRDGEPLLFAEDRTDGLQGLPHLRRRPCRRLR